MRNTIAFALVLTFCGAVSYLLLRPTRKVHGSTAVEAAAVQTFSYQDCDPVAQQGCLPGGKELDYLESTGERITTTQVGANLNQTVIKGRGVFINYFADVNRHYTLQGPKWIAAGMQAVDRPKPEAGCTVSNATFGGDDHVQGYGVVKYTSQDPHGVSTVWLAPELNCLLLRQQEDWMENGQPSGHHFYKLAQSIQIGKRPDSDFAAPGTSTEVSPLEVQHQLFIWRSKRADPSLQLDAIESNWKLKEPQSAKNWAIPIAAWSRQHPGTTP
ncbi:MAG TPA: hypothetical protein VGL53_23590 [Bryobacteraceae bacterium]|jgi:hypothetical protein